MFCTSLLKSSRVAATASYTLRKQLSSGPATSIKVEKLPSGIVNIILARHDGKNSFSKLMIKEFRAAIADVSIDTSARCVILKSEVPKVFCAGADLKERLAMPDNEISNFVTGLRDTMAAVANIPVPTIAAIEGVAFGGGLELALACDIRVAGSDAQLGLTETALAIIPGAGGSQRLPRLIGVAKAKELIYTAARLTSQEALSLGLVNHSVPSGSAVAKAEELAASIVEKGPVAIRMAKQAIDTGASLDMAKALQVEKMCYDELVMTQDRKEGLNAFVEKRKPKYKGC